MQPIALLNKIAKDNDISLSRFALDAGLSKNYFTAQKARGSTPNTEQIVKLLASVGYGLYAAPLDARLDEREDVTRIDGEGND